MSYNTELEVILTHEHADFDALASLLAASLLYPNALPVLPRRINGNVRAFLEEFKRDLPFVQAQDVPRGHVGRAILVDTDGVNLVKGMDDETAYFVIDHHTRARPMPEEWQVWSEPVGANTTLLVEKLQEQGMGLSSTQATLLALGIHEDTGSLTYAVTTDRDAMALGWLLGAERAADLEIIGRHLNFPLSQDQRHLLALLQEQSEFVTLAQMNIMVAQADARNFSDEFSALAGWLRDLYELDALFMILEKNELVQVVARSTTDAIDVGQIARTLGGDGHTRAAAAPVRMQSRAETRDRIFKLLHEQLAPPHATSDAPSYVGQIMSVGTPRVLPPELSVEDALTLMRRYGHEGFPVVQMAADVATIAQGLDAEVGSIQAEQLLGLITRRDVDRAFDHGMVKKPLQRIMRAGQVTVHEDDSLDQLRSLMAHSGWGQVPVVNDRSEIVGIVTRTDLLRQGEQSLSLPFQPREVARRLEHFLLPEHHYLLHVLGQQAAKLDFTIYVVGGFVRDLLLSELLATTQSASTRLLTDNVFANGSLDVDIVLEGDAIAFAQHVQEHFGGRILTHRRFGTAKWLLNDPDNPVDAEALLTIDAENGPKLQPEALPFSLDFVTARTEFYTAPTALPTVERGSIKLDLYRRDFTINTLAICLNPRRWGELLDFYGGIHDLQRGAIRVLHSLSFVDDPTRMMRAVRYEQRFGFRIESHTLELLRDSLSLLRRVTPVRIVHELERTFLEEQPESALQRLDELEMLAQIHEDLCVDPWVNELFPHLRAALRTWGNEANDAGMQMLHTALRQTPLDRLYWALLMLPLPATLDKPLAKKLRLRKETTQLVAELRVLQRELPALQQEWMSPSQITAILDQAAPVAIALVGVAHGRENGSLLARLSQYVAEWRELKPLLNGHDLAALGVPRGPLFRRILEALRTARLDGVVQSRQDEVAFTERWVEEEA